VSLTRRPEIRFHAQMNFEILALKPTAAALRKMGGLGYLLNPQRAPP